MKVCIIGAGVTGLILLLVLVSHGVDPSTICIIDPYFDGGDLFRKWGNVQSNTPIGKVINSFKMVLPKIRIPAPKNLDATTPLSTISDIILRLSNPIAAKRINGFVQRVCYSKETRAWTIEYMGGAGPESLMTSCVLLAPGSEPQIMPHPTPSIPLECALDLKRLKEYVKPGDSVVVFGTMHSGTLVMKNLHDLSIKTTAVYRSEKPFAWERDGDYGGIKFDSAMIADDIMNGRYRHLTLLNANQVDEISAAVRESTWVVYAIGFKPRQIDILVDGEVHDGHYDALTGVIGPNAWGFGIAYPNSAPDGIHYDVSVPAFLSHISSQIGSIITAIR